MNGSEINRGFRLLFISDCVSRRPTSAPRLLKSRGLATQSSLITLRKPAFDIRKPKSSSVAEQFGAIRDSHIVLGFRKLGHVGINHDTSQLGRKDFGHPMEEF